MFAKLACGPLKFPIKSTETLIHLAVVFRPPASNKMAIKSNYCYLLLLSLFQLSILVYVMILNKIIYEKSSPRMNLKK